MVPGENDRNKENTGVRRGVPTSKGLYLKGQIQGVNVIFTTDTGATRTIISRQVYEQIPESKRPQLENKPLFMKGCNGKPVTELGIGLFQVHIASLVFERKILVAEIDDQVLLGIDILQSSELGGPADILLSQNVIKMKDVSIPCFQVGTQETTRKVVAADHHIIPAMSEAIVNVFVERYEADDNRNSTFIVEACDNFRENQTLLMAETIIDLNHRPTCAVKVINPTKDEVSIKQDAVIGQAERFDPEENLLITLTEGNSDTTCPENEESADFQQHIRHVKENNELPAHLTSMLDNAIKDHSKREQTEIKELLIKFQDIFSKDELDIGRTNLTEHSINTGDASPIKQRARREPLAFAGEERKAIDGLLKQGVIRESTSPWAAPIVLVRKKNGKVRACIDYRRLNAVTEKDAFPLPRTQECLDAVAGAKYFSTMDLTSGYYQVPVKEEDIPKTAFVTKSGLYEFVTMPMGLTSAGATFQRLMELALHQLNWVTCLVYLDDVIVYGTTFDEHIQRLEQVMERIRQANLKLKPEKCHLFQQEVEFLGHLISGDGIKPAPRNLLKIKKFPTPTSVTDVRRILGMGSYYRRFIPRYADLVKPLTDLTKKGVPFKWTNECKTALDQLKDQLLGPEIMGYPLETGEFILDTDASGKGIGAVLSQVQNGRERVITYASRTMQKAERNYCVTDQELLALRYFIEYFRQYLLGRKFKVRTDHQALVWLFSFKEPKSRIARWLEVLSSYDFEVEYRPESKHRNADFMSRCIDPKDCQCPDSDNLENLRCGPCGKCRKRAIEMQSKMLCNNDKPSSKINRVRNKTEGTVYSVWKKILQLLSILFLFVTQGVQMAPNVVKNGGQGKFWSVDNWCCAHLLRRVKTRSLLNETDELLKPWCGMFPFPKLKKLQEEDAAVGLVIGWMKDGKRPESSTLVKMSPEIRHYCNVWESLVLKNGLLFREFQKRDGSGKFLQFVTPRSMRNDILKQMHNVLLSGHLGAKKTREKTLQRYYWFEIREDVNLWVKKCDECAANKEPCKFPKAPMCSMRVGAPMDRLATDILGPLPLTPRGNRYILLVTDHFSKWVEVIPVPDQTAVTCAEKILNEVIARFGCPLDLHSDQGRNYDGDIFKELCRLLDVRKTRTSPRNPKCNGLTERFNRTLLRMIKAYLQGEQSNWDLHLGCLAAAYRATAQESTGLTPNLLMLGREVRLPGEICWGSKCNEGNVTSYGDYVTQLRERIQHAHSIARKHLGKAATHQKKNYDARTGTGRRE